LWIATSAGLDRLDKGSDKFVHYRFDPLDRTSISCSNVRSLYEDKDSILWVGTGSVFMQDHQVFKTLGGLNKFDRKTGKFSRYLHDPGNEHSLIDNRVTTMFEDSRGTFWVGTGGDGLHTMNRITGSFTRHRFDPLEPGKLSRPALRKSAYFWAEDFISLITESFDGKILIGTFSNGIHVYDRLSRKIKWYGSDANSTVRLRDTFFWRSYTTRDQTVWLCAMEGNLYRVARQGNPIINHQKDSVVVTIMEDKDETLWIGTLSGLVKQDKAGHRTKYFVDPVNEASLANHVFPMYREGSLLTVATIYGLYQFDTKTTLFSRYLHYEPGSPNSMSSDTIPAMVKTKEGDLFFSTARGLNMLEPSNKRVLAFRHDPNDTTSISSDLVFFVALDGDDNVWGGGLEGAFRFDKSLKTFKRYRIGEVVYGMKDSKGTLWVGGRGGLFSYDRRLDEFIKFKDQFQLIPPSTLVGFIAEDQKNNLWIGTSLGVIQLLAAENMRPIVLTRERGLDPMTLNTGVVLSNGNLLLGSMHGYYEILPSLFNKVKMAHSIVIERFLLNNIPLFPSPEGILKYPLSKTKEILLSHDQNTFAFEFTDIDFSDLNDEPSIIYKLEQYDRVWRNVTVSKSASYFNVTPGTYQFRVKSFDVFGNQSESSLVVTIAPPWWKTWWAYVGFGLTALGTAGLVYISRISTLRKQQAAQIRVMVAIQEDERKRISRDLHDDIGTKLSALKLFLTSLREKVSVHGDAEVEALAKTSEQFIGEAMADVRTLLANLSPSVLEEFGYTVAVEGLINKLNETRQASFKLSVFGMERRLKPAYELALYRITQELINNVMKHAAAHSVSLQIGQRDERIVLMIEDDGKGFDTGINTGGYGLKNLAARCKLMQGSMSIDSRLGMGTSVMIEIPYDHQSI
ncbi:MAG TPA: two-component regulator propeller domain-containing protein, partial [Chryseolinea sp.]|nr:two-component regulator propeller domain-containing protein [Chryseolinea sp.]